MESKACSSALILTAGRPDVVTGGYSECMTGFEYAAAIGMLQEGQIDSGLKCIEAIPLAL